MGSRCQAQTPNRAPAGAEIRFLMRQTKTPSFRAVCLTLRPSTDANCSFDSETAGEADFAEPQLSRQRDLGVAAVPHGFRSSFRDWAAERTNHPREVIEAALAHTVRNQTEAAYARSDLFERRRHLMNDWAAYLDGRRGQVIPLRR